MKYFLYAILAWIIIIPLGYGLYLLTGIEQFGYPLTWTIYFVFMALQVVSNG